MLNAIAGGGSFLTFPAQVFTAGGQPRLSRQHPGLQGRTARAATPARWRDPGGCFNGGLGILLMALYPVAGESKLNSVNALKNFNSLVLFWLSVAAFVIAGAIAWKRGLLMMVAATAVGYFGARWSKALPVAWVRRGVIVIGQVMSAVFFTRL